MRSQRGAALAASAAIKAQSDSADAIISASSADVAFEPGSKRKKRAVTSAVAVTNGSVTIDKPAPIDTLPYELRQLVISYLEDDLYTILNLLLVSKVWYVTLMHGKQADEDWARRCRRLGAKRKSSGCTTWHSTLIKLLHKCCISCSANASKKMGPLLPYGFTFIRLCLVCPLGPSSPSMRMVNIQDIRESQPDLAFQLTKIPVFQLMNHYDRYGYRGEIFVKTEAMYDDEYEDYWTTAAAASLARARLRKEYAHSQRLADTIPETSKRDLLKDAFAYIREWKDPKCTPLVEAVCALHAADPAEGRHFSQALTVYETLQSVLVARDAFLRQHQLNDTQAKPTLSHYFSDDSCPEHDTWINHLVRGDIAIGTYLEVAKGNHERKEKAEQAYKKKLKRRKAEQRRWRLAGEHVESLCIAPDCDRYVPDGCINVTCSLHCPGSCPLHEGHHSDTSDGSMASSYDNFE